MDTWLGLGSLIPALGTSANNLWAVGDDPYGSLLIWRWNGSKWQQVKGDRPPGSEHAILVMRDVGAPSAHEAWAVGGYQLSKREGSVNVTDYHPVLEHWDGARWRLVNLAAIPTSWSSRRIEEALMKRRALPIMVAALDGERRERRWL